MTSSPRIAAVVLAAGRSTRMAPHNKLLLEAGGEALIRRVARAALATPLAPVVVVTGHDAARIEDALRGLTVQCAHNATFGDGLASSLATGLRALPAGVAGALILLGDMPDVEARHLRALCDAFAPHRGHSVCVPTFQGQRGNPVLWGAEHFPELLGLRGDRGARGLLEHHGARLCEVAMSDAAVLRDVDDAQALARGPQAIRC